MTLTKRISLHIVSALFGVFSSVHQSTTYISMPEDDMFYMYNNGNEYGPEEIASLDELFPNGKGFIVGYITHA